jgi:diguanylate cyclase (GGDEF)-like protein/PAS domain S-box-containing protein
LKDVFQINTESEIESLLDFIGNASESIHLVDGDGVILWANKTELDILGYTFDEYVGQSISNFHTAPTTIANILQKLGNFETLKNYPAELQAKDGSVRHVLINSNTYQKNGKFIHTRCFSRDITEKVQFEKEREEYLVLLQHKNRELEDSKKAIAQSEEKFRLLVDAIDEVFWMSNFDLTELIYVSPGCEKIWGLKAADLYQSPRIFIDAIHLEDRSNYLCIIDTYHLKGQSYECEYRIFASDGTLRWINERGYRVKNKEIEPSYMARVCSDITEGKKANEKLKYQASHDELTGLFNRREFEHRAKHLLSTNQQDRSEHALCYLDLDQFKVVNDTCGHFAGDELLRQLGQSLQTVVRHRDTLARLGGDEFGVLVEHCSLEQAERVATSLLQGIQNFRFFWEGQSFRVSASIGMVAINDTVSDLTELLQQADAACYMAKDSGRNRIHTYHPEDTELVQRHGEMLWVSRITQALEDNRFCLYAQVIVPLYDSTDQHYELLLRMLDEQGDIIPPGTFLPAAERYNLIEKIDAWVIQHAFDLLAAHPTFVEQVNFISINLSGPSLTNGGFLKSIISQINASGIEPGKICFEVTETVAISNMSAAITFITILKQVGCQFALDDFGSGLSSFGYLKKLPVDYLKIDGMFVKDMVDDPIDHAMVKCINDIGHVMGMKTIAEFVENDDIKNKLIEIGIDYVQGYGIGKPEPLEKILREYSRSRLS